jgi:hypothetical protein
MSPIIAKVPIYSSVGRYSKTKKVPSIATIYSKKELDIFFASLRIRKKITSCDCDNTTRRYIGLNPLKKALMFRYTKYIQQRERIMFVKNELLIKYKKHPQYNMEIIFTKDAFVYLSTNHL